MSNSRKKAGLGLLSAVALFAGQTHAAITTSGGGLTLVQQGNTFDANNLAAGQHAFAPNIEGQDPPAGWPSPDQPTGYGGFHNTAGTTNGVYGNAGGTWLAGSNGSYLGLNLGGSFTIQSVAYGRDNLAGFADRATGLVTLEYTTDASPSLSSTWTTIGSMDYNATPTLSAKDSGPALRHRFNFTPVTATGVRLVTAVSGRGIDELEVYSSAKTIPTLTPNVSLVQDETTNATGLPNQGTSIPAEPAPGNGQYHYANGPGTFTWTPGVEGANVKVEASWGVSFNHSLDVDYYFDPDGPLGPLPEVALSQDLRQDRLADQTTTPPAVEWSGYYQIASGLTLTDNSTFRVTGTNSANGVAPEALSSSVWRFTAVPEPTSLSILCIGAIAAFRRRRA